MCQLVNRIAKGQQQNDDSPACSLSLHVHAAQLIGSQSECCCTGDYSRLKPSPIHAHTLVAFKLLNYF